MGLLVGPYLKTRRAEEHLENLRSQLRVFYDSEPCRFIREDDVENQMHLIRMKIADIPDPIPLIAGDAISNLRASLDHLVWQLAVVPGEYPTKTQFPIFDKPNRRRFRGFTAGIPVQGAKMIP